MSRFTVHDLAATIDARAASGGEASYTRKLLDKGHAKGSAIQLASALKGVLIPLHPGAEKYYKEIGMVK